MPISATRSRIAKDPTENLWPPWGSVLLVGAWWLYIYIYISKYNKNKLHIYIYICILSKHKAISICYIMYIYIHIFISIQVGCVSQNSVPALVCGISGYVSQVCFAKVEHTWSWQSQKAYKSIYQLPLQDSNAQLSDSMLFSFCRTNQSLSTCHWSTLLLVLVLVLRLTTDCTAIWCAASYNWQKHHQTPTPAVAAAAAATTTTTTTTKTLPSPNKRNLYLPLNPQWPFGKCPRQFWSR